jgi:hypothetical protein
MKETKEPGSKGSSEEGAGEMGWKRRRKYEPRSLEGAARQTGTPRFLSPETASAAPAAQFPNTAAGRCSLTPTLFKVSWCSRSLHHFPSPQRDTTYPDAPPGEKIHGTHVQSKGADSLRCEGARPGHPTPAVYTPHRRSSVRENNFLSFYYLFLGKLFSH